MEECNFKKIMKNRNNKQIVMEYQNWFRIEIKKLEIENRWILDDNKVS